MHMPSEWMSILSKQKKIVRQRAASTQISLCIHVAVNIIFYRFDSIMEQCRYWSDYLDARADLGLRWSHMSYVRFRFGGMFFFFFFFFSFWHLFYVLRTFRKLIPIRSRSIIIMLTSVSKIFNGYVFLKKNGHFIIQGRLKKSDIWY